MRIVKEKDAVETTVWVKADSEFGDEIRFACLIDAIVPRTFDGYVVELKPKYKYKGKRRKMPETRFAWRELQTTKPKAEENL